VAPSFLYIAFFRLLQLLIRAFFLNSAPEKGPLASLYAALLGRYESSSKEGPATAPCLKGSKRLGSFDLDREPALI
jgi:hypothetical protein